MSRSTLASRRRRRRRPTIVVIVLFSGLAVLLTAAHVPAAMTVTLIGAVASAAARTTIRPRPS